MSEDIMQVYMLGEVPDVEVYDYTKVHDSIRKVHKEKGLPLDLDKLNTVAEVMHICGSNGNFRFELESFINEVATYKKVGRV